MDKFLAFVGAAIILLVAVTGAYVSGRILLPEMGLTAPPWTAWFWSTMFVTVVGVIARSVVDFLKGL